MHMFVANGFHCERRSRYCMKVNKDSREASYMLPGRLDVCALVLRR